MSNIETKDMLPLMDRAYDAGRKAGERKALEDVTEAIARCHGLSANQRLMVIGTVNAVKEKERQP